MKVKLLGFLLILCIITGCENSKVSNDESNNTTLQSVDELNETVWEDSQKAFDIITKKFEDFSNVTESEFEELDNYIDKYYKSGYVESENAKSLLVRSIHLYDVNVTLRGIGDEESQKERLSDIQKTYMEIEQLLKEH